MTLSELRTLTLPDDARARITAACRVEASKRRSPRPILLVAACVALMATVTLSVGAATDWFTIPERSTTHFPATPSEIVLVQPNGAVVVAPLDSVFDGSPLRLICTGAMVGGDGVYFDLVLTRIDGKEIFGASSGQTPHHIEFPNAAVTFADGYEKPLYIAVLEDSTPERFHIEGSILLADDEMGYLNQDAALSLGEIELFYAVEDGWAFKLQADEGFTLAVTLPGASSKIDYAISPVTITANGATIVLDRLTLDGSSLSLIGRYEGPLGLELTDLEPILDGATLTLSDGTVVACGTKNGAGSYPDGRFVLDWLIETVVDATKVVSLTLDDQRISIG